MGKTARCENGGVAMPVYRLAEQRWVGTCDSCTQEYRAKRDGSSTAQLVAVCTWVDEHDGHAADREARVAAQIKQMQETQR